MEPALQQKLIPLFIKSFPRSYNQNIFLEVRFSLAQSLAQFSFLLQKLFGSLWYCRSYGDWSSWKLYLLSVHLTPNFIAVRQVYRAFLSRLLRVGMKIEHSRPYKLYLLMITALSLQAKHIFVFLAHLYKVCSIRCLTLWVAAPCMLLHFTTSYWHVV